MEVRDLFGTLRRFWLLVVAVLVAALALGYLAAYIPAERYRARATLIVTPVSKQIDYTTVQTVQYLLPSLAAQVDTASFANQVRNSVPSTVPWDSVSLKATDEPGTSIVRVQVETLNPFAAAVIANAAAKNLIAKKISNLVQVKLLDPARPPAGSFSPNRELILFAATVIGLIGGVLAAIGANAYLPRVRTASEIRRRFGLEVIAEIPQSRGFPKRPSRLFDPMAHHTGLVEAYHRLRANFEIVSAGRKVVAITSCVAGEGKSAVAANLAWAVASMGEKVVAVDTDLRRPTMHEYFGLRLGMGVADIPHGADIEQLAQPTDVPTLRVLPAGYAVEHPTSILHNAYERILDAFDDSLLIVDVPPLLSTADAMLVATMTKAVILVADARHGDPSELDQVLIELERARADVLGVVLNRVTLKRSQRTDVYYTEAARRLGAPPKRRRLRSLLPGGKSGPGPAQRTTRPATSEQARQALSNANERPNGPAPTPLEPESRRAPSQ